MMTKLLQILLVVVMIVLSWLPLSALRALGAGIDRKSVV